MEKSPINLSNNLSIFHPEHKMRHAVSLITEENLLKESIRLEKYNTMIVDKTLEEESPKENPMGDSSISFSKRANFLNTKFTMTNNQVQNHIGILNKQFDFTNFTHLQVLIYILKKSPYKKTNKELEFMQNAFSNISFLSNLQHNFNQETYFDILRQLRYEYGTKERKVFNYGDMGRKFYIILDGKVLVLIPHNNEILLSSEPKTQSCKNIEDEEIEIPIETKILMKNPNFSIINELKRGDSFGEIALLNSVTRTASCYCKEETHFVVLTSESYSKTISHFHRKLYYELLTLLDESDYFKKWPVEIKNIISIHFKLREVRKGTIIYSEDEDSNYMYLIKKGEIEISTLITNLKTASMKNLEILDDIKLLETDLEKPLKKQYTHINSIWNQQENKIKLERVLIALLQKKEIFGEMEIFENTKRTTKAIVKSDKAYIYQIEKNKLLENVPMFLKEKLIQMINEKKKWHWKIIKNSKLISKEFSSQLTKTLYKTEKVFTKSRNMLAHIQSKNKKIIDNLPMSLTFNYHTNKFLKTAIEKFPSFSNPTERPEIEKAIFPETTLIPFKKKLQALNIGLKHFKPSQQLKQKLDSIVYDNTMKYKNRNKKNDTCPFNLNEILNQVDYEKEDDMTVIFKNKKNLLDEENIKKMKSNKITVNPILTLYNNLNLKLLIPEKEDKVTELKIGHLPDYKINKIDITKKRIDNLSNRENYICHLPKKFPGRKLSTFNVNQALDNNNSVIDLGLTNNSNILKIKKKNKKYKLPAARTSNFWNRQMVFITEDET